MRTLFLPVILFVASLSARAQFPPAPPRGNLLFKIDYPESELRPDMQFRIYYSTSFLSKVAAPPIVQPLNGSFEEGLRGWALNGNLRLAPQNASDGTNCLQFNAGNGEANGTAIAQPLTTLSGQAYDLLFDVGINAYNTSEQRLLVNLQSGNNLVANTITLTGDGTGNCVWTHQTIPFTAGTNITMLSFYDRSPATDAVDLWLDNIRFIPKWGTNITSPWKLLQTYSGTNRTFKASILPGPEMFFVMTVSNFYGEQAFSSPVDIPPVPKIAVKIDVKLVPTGVP